MSSELTSDIVDVILCGFYPLYNLIADVVEYVLASEGRKVLYFQISNSSLSTRSAEMLQGEFGHKEHFNKQIIILLYEH